MKSCCNGLRWAAVDLPIQTRIQLVPINRIHPGGCWQPSSCSNLCHRPEWQPEDSRQRLCIGGTKSSPHSAGLHQRAKWIGVEQCNILPYINKHLGGDNEKKVVWTIYTQQQMPFNSYFKLSMISAICPSHPHLLSPTETPLEYFLKSLHFTEANICITSTLKSNNNILKEIWRNHLPKKILV